MVTPKNTYDYFFPDTLRDKKLKMSSHSIRPSDAKWRSLLEQYLTTKDPRYLFRAIHINFYLLKGHGRNLETEDFDLKKGEVVNYGESEYVDPHTITWESINSWWKIAIFAGDQEEEHAKSMVRGRAEMLLTQVGRSLIPSRMSKECHTVDGLKHVFPRKKSMTPKITYQDAEDFIKYFETIRNVLSSARTQRQYKRGKKDILITDLTRAIREDLNDEISEDAVADFDLTYIATIAASYIAWKHQQVCRICEHTGVSTILNLLNEAKREIPLKF